jgi:hypothetical protein
MESDKKIKAGAIEDYISASAITALATKLAHGGYAGNAKDLETLIVTTLSGGPKGSIVPTDTPTGTGSSSWIATQSGTYTNFGGLVVNANSFAVISRDASGVFSISQTAFDITSKVNVSDIKNDLFSTDVNKPGSANNDRLLNEKFNDYLKYETGNDIYALAIVDSDNRLLGGWLKDGSWKPEKYLNNSIDGVSLKQNSVTVEKLDNNLKTYFPENIIPEIPYIYTLVDSKNTLLFGVKNDGTFVVGKYENNSIAGSILKDKSITAAKLTDEVKSYFPTDLNYESGYSYAIVDLNNTLLFGVKNDGTFVAPKFTYSLSDGSVTFSKLTTDLQAKINAGGNTYVTCYGDSLTAGAGGNGTTYPNVLSSLLGATYSVINCGVGGENVPTIAARQGAVSALITSSFTLPADTSTVEVSSDANIRLKNSLNGYQIKPLMQGATTLWNPCYIQDVECTLSYNATGGIYSIKRNIAAASTKNIVANSILIPVGAKIHRKQFASVIYIGQNGGYTNDAELVDYYKRMIDFSGCDNYILIGMHSGTASSRASIELAMLNTFGARFLNWREYVSNYGLIDAGLTPTTADTTAMALGSIPPQLLSDSVHLTTASYTLLGNQIYKRFKELGYIV